MRRGVAIVVLDAKNEDFGFDLVMGLREKEISSDMFTSDMTVNRMSLNRMMKVVDICNFLDCVVIGEDEMKSRVFKIRDMADGEEEVVGEDKLLKELVDRNGG